MGQTEWGILGIVVLMVLLMLGAHVGLTMVLVGFLGFAAIGGFHGAISNLATVPFDRLYDYHFGVLPLFLLMGAFVAHSGIGYETYEFARAWLGRLRGGLAMASVLACALIAAMAGTSAVGTVIMGQVAYPEMKRLGYSDRLSSGVISAGGTLGILIPPSMGFMLIGILTELSIGKLFMAGIIPGILEAVFYIITVAIMCRIKPSLAPLAASVTWKERIVSVNKTWPVLALFLLVMGGIYAGVFTPTEAGGIGAFGALLISLATRKIGGRGIWAALIEGARMTSMIIIMIIGAFIFNAFLAITQISNTISEFIAGLPVHRMIILVCIIMFYIICGMFFDIIAVLILTIPILYPLVDALGFNLIWYSVLMVRIVEIGMITPPFGINLFILCGVIKEPLGTIYRGVIPFIIADFCHVALLIAVPQLSLFLPNMM